MRSGEGGSPRRPSGQAEERDAAGAVDGRQTEHLHQVAQLRWLASRLSVGSVDVAEPQVAWWTRAVGKREAQYPGDQSSYLRDLAAGKTLTIRLSPEAVRMADASVDGARDDPRRRPWRLIVHLS